MKKIIGNNKYNLLINNLKELAEELLRRNGFQQFRVRDHNNLARIELSEADREKILDLNLMDKLSDKLQKLGFQYITLDLSV